MLSKHSVESSGECFIPWDSAPAYAALLRTQSEDYACRMHKVKFFEIEQEEAEKQQTLSILQFIEKVISYLKLYNVRIAFSEEKKIEQKLEKIIDKIVSLQGQLIASKT